MISKYDIREWRPDGEKMGKGVTLSKEELVALKELLNKIEVCWVGNGMIYLIKLPSHVMSKRVIHK